MNGSYAYSMLEKLSAITNMSKHIKKTCIASANRVWLDTRECQLAPDHVNEENKNKNKMEGNEVEKMNEWSDSKNRKKKWFLWILLINISLIKQHESLIQGWGLKKGKGQIMDKKWMRVVN